MFGPPVDVEGECNARLFIGDDYADNHTTIRCTLEPTHQPPHIERFADRDVEVRWTVDEREEEEG